MKKQEDLKILQVILEKIELTIEHPGALKRHHKFIDNAHNSYKVEMSRETWKRLEPLTTAVVNYFGKEWVLLQEHPNIVIGIAE